jgi:hypothetical protein
MKLGTTLAGLGMAALMISTSAGRELKTDNRTIAAEGAKRLEIKCEFGAGRLEIEPASMADAVKIDAEYNPDRVDLEVDYHVRGETGTLKVETDHHGGNIRSEDNRLSLTLSDKFPTELRLEIGACKGDIELGGIPLTLFDLEIGAASGTISFSKPNPERMRRMNIDIGASAARLYNLGNANFELLKCGVGAASSRLDFRGEYHGESEIRLDVGVASADVILPADIPVRIESDGGWFSSIKFHHDNLDEVDDDVWESPGYDAAKDRILLKIDVGMGSVNLTFE